MDGYNQGFQHVPINPVITAFTLKPLWPLLDMITGSMVAMNPLWPSYTFTDGHAITIFHGVLMNGPIIDDGY